MLDTTLQPLQKPPIHNAFGAPHRGYVIVCSKWNNLIQRLVAGRLISKFELVDHLQLPEIDSPHLNPIKGLSSPFLYAG